MQYGGGGAVQFGVQPVGGGGVAPYPGAQPQGGQFARGAVQQQQPPQAFGGFVAATPPPQITNTSQQKPSNQFNWGPVPAPVGQHSSAGPASSGASATKSVFSSSSSSPQARSGWSQGMSKMTPPSTWGGATAAPVSAQGPSMWSSGLTGSQPPQPAQAGGGFGAFTSGQPVQPVQQAPPPGGSGPTANPFAVRCPWSSCNSMHGCSGVDVQILPLTFCPLPFLSTSLPPSLSRPTSPLPSVQASTHSSQTNPFL